MITVTFEKALEGKSLALCWDHIPMVGDLVDLTQDRTTQYEYGFSGFVSQVSWWRDGSVRVVLR